MSLIVNSMRSLSVETPQGPPLSPRKPYSPTKKSPLKPNRGFMKSTASSNSKVVSSSPVAVPADAKAKREAMLDKLAVPADAKAMHEDMLDKLKNNIIRFTRSSDRRMLLRTLKDCSYLQNISVVDANAMLVLPSTDEAWRELELEVSECAPIELNGMLLGAGLDEKNKRKEGDKLLYLLILLCNKLAQGLTKCASNCYMQVDSADLFQALLVRLSPKNSAATAYFQVNSIIGNNELAVQVPKKPVKPVRGTSLTVYVADNAVHAVIEHHHAYGLFRKSDSAGKPWIGLTAVTHERVNLTTGISVRRVAVQIHEEKFSLY